MPAALPIDPDYIHQQPLPATAEGASAPTQPTQTTFASCVPEVKLDALESRLSDEQNRQIVIMQQNGLDAAPSYPSGADIETAEAHVESGLLSSARTESMRTQDHADIDTAIRFSILANWAAAATPELSRNKLARPTAHCTKTLEGVVNLLSSFVAMHPPADHEAKLTRDARWCCVGELAKALCRSAMLTKSIQQLNEGIDHLQQIIQLSPPAHRSRVEAIPVLEFALFFRRGIVELTPGSRGSHFHEVETQEQLSLTTMGHKSRNVLISSAHHDASGEIRILFYFKLYYEPFIANTTLSYSTTMDLEMDETHEKVGMLSSTRTISMRPDDDADIDTAIRFSILNRWARAVMNEFSDAAAFKSKPRRRNELIAVLSGFLDLYPLGEAESISIRDARWECATALSWVLYNSAMITDNVQQLDEAIDRTQQVLQFRPHDTRPGPIILLAHALHSRYRLQTRQHDDCRLILTLCEMLELELTPTDSFWAAMTLAEVLARRLEPEIQATALNSAGRGNSTELKDQSIRHLVCGHTSVPTGTTQDIHIGVREQTLENAISLITRTIQAHSIHSQLHKIHTNLGRIYQYRHKRSHDLRDLRTAVSWLQQAVESSSGQPEQLAHLGAALARLYEQTNDIQDSDVAIKYLQAAASKSAGVSSGGCLSSAHINLGSVFFGRYRTSEDIKDLYQAERLLKDVVERCPAEDPFFKKAYCNLGRTLVERFDIGDEHVLEESIQVLQLALDLPSASGDDVGTYVACVDLGHAYIERFKISGTEHDSDLDRATTLLQRAASLHRHLSEHRPANEQQYLFEIQLLRSQSTNDTEGINEAIKQQRAAVDSCPMEGPDSPLMCRLQNLVQALRTRFIMLGDITDIDEAINLQHKIIRRRSRHTASSILFLLVLLDHRLHEQEQHAELQASDVDELIKWAEDAAAITTCSRPLRARILDAHARALRRKYRISRDILHLDSSIKMHEEVFQLAPGDSAFLVHFATCLGDHYNVTGDQRDLNRMIDLCRRAIKECSPRDTYMRASALQLVGNALQARYSLCELPADFEEAVAAYRQGLDLRPPGNPDRWISFRSLGDIYIRAVYRMPLAGSLETVLTYLQEAQRRSWTSLLSTASTYYQEALSCFQGDQHQRVKIIWEMNLCLAMRGYSECSAAIDLAIAQCKQVGSRSAPDIVWFMGVSQLYISRFYALRDSKDLAEAINNLEEALQLAPLGHPARGYVVVSLALVYVSSLPREYINPHHFLEILEEGIDIISKAAHSHPDLIFGLVMGWVALAHLLGDGSILRAHKSALLCVTQMMTLYPTAELQRRCVAQKASSLGSDACSLAIVAGELGQAVEFLEQGRGILWARLGQFRHTMDALRRVDNELAEEFELASRELEMMAVSSIDDSLSEPLTVFNLLLRTADAELRRTGRESPPAAPLIPVLGQRPELRFAQDRSGLDGHLRHLDHQSSRWNTVVERIRQVDDFSNFLLPVPLSDLQKAASGGPVVVVNASHLLEDNHSCNAIIVRDSHPLIHVPLPDASLEQSNGLSERLNQALDSLHSLEHGSDDERQQEYYRKEIKTVLQSLWSSIVRPIVEKLEEIGYEHGSRIWWYLAGSLCRLPFHAAGPYKRDQPNFYDLYISSYMTTLASTLKSLQAVSASENTPPNLLVIAVPGDESRQADFLHNVKEEADTLLEVIPPGCLSSQQVLIGELATPQAVQSELPNYSWVHFMCHGYQDAQPFDSSFQLHGDKHLKLIELVQYRLPKAQLAFLSACNTATGDFEKTPNEIIHLAAVMQFCGFHSVIGTLWAMHDDDGPSVARDFYKFMFRNGSNVDFRDSAEGLHRAVGELRRKKVPIERWINFVHFGL